MALTEGDKAMMREMATIAAKAVIEEFKKELKGQVRALFLGVCIASTICSGSTIGVLRLIRVF